MAGLSEWVTRACDIQRVAVVVGHLKQYHDINKVKDKFRVWLSKLRPPLSLD